MHFRTRKSVRLPTFFGPFMLASALLLVSNFSEPFWQNFYTVQARSENVSLKMGAWGLCTKYLNTTGVNGSTTFCTDKSSGYDFFVYENTSGNTQFPLVKDDNILFGLKPANASEAGTQHRIVSSGSTKLYWLNVVTAIFGIACCLTLATPPEWLGQPDSFLYKFQKSGLLPMFLGLVSFAIAIAAFIVDLVVAIPARNRLNEIEGITAKLGNVQWFVLPSLILMIPAFISISMSPSENEFAAL